MSASNTRAFVRVALAAVILFSNTWLLNLFMMPVVDTVTPALRDIAYVLRGVLLAAIAFAATRNASVMQGRWLFPVSYAVLGLGIVAGLIAWASPSPAAIVVWFLLNTAGSGLAYLIVGAACASLPLAPLTVMIPAAYAVAGVLQAVGRATVVAPPVALTTLLSLAAALLSAPSAKAVLQHIDPAISPDDARLAQPLSFPSFLSQLFVCLFAFQIVRGIALSFEATEGVPVDSALVAIPMALVAINAAFLRSRKREYSPDLMLQIAFIVSLGGMVFTLASAHTPPGLVHLLLLTGGDMCLSLSWCVLAVLAIRNPLGTIRVFAWGNAAMSFGVVGGAALGRSLSGAGVLQLPSEMVVGIAVVAFAAYFVYFLTHHSIAEAIRQVQPVEPLEPADQLAETDASWENRVADLARGHGLTPRETEIMELLARGRNGHYIADELSISYNTVKTHVSHVYDKLGVHSQQDLIDLVESR